VVSPILRCRRSINGAAYEFHVPVASRVPVELGPGNVPFIPRVSRLPAAQEARSLSIEGEWQTRRRRDCFLTGAEPLWPLQKQASTSTSSPSAT